MRDHLSPSNQADYGIADGVVIDFDTLYLGAQSSGSHVAVNYLALGGDCTNVHGMFLMSPVDGVDPYGLINQVCIDPPNLLNFQLPTLIIAGGLDSVPGVDGLGNLFPACAPEVIRNGSPLSLLYLLHSGVLQRQILRCLDWTHCDDKHYPVRTYGLC